MTTAIAPSVTIRQAMLADAAGILNVLNPIIKAGIYTAIDRPYTLEEQATDIANFPSYGTFLVAECVASQAIVGLQSIESHFQANAFRHVGDISTFVSLEARGQGIGHQLTQASLPLAYDVGFRKISAMVRADNPGAAAFYKRQGFDHIGTARHHAHLQGRYIDELLLELWLEDALSPAQLHG